MQRSGKGVGLKGVPTDEAVRVDQRAAKYCNGWQLTQPTGFETISKCRGEQKAVVMNGRPQILGQKFRPGRNEGLADVICP